MKKFIKLFIFNISWFLYVNYTFKSCPKLIFHSQNIIFALMPYLILRKCNDIGKLLAPPNFIKEWLITDIFTGVTV